jgi:hypothetical protein
VDEALDDLTTRSGLAGDVEILHVAGTLESRVLQVRARVQAQAISS